MINVLLIGCGNIGAGYDLQNDQVLTYAKAFSRDTDFVVTIHDQNIEIQQQIAANYGFKTIDNPLGDPFSRFEIVCIATPTTTHFSYLEKAIREKVPVICCEKPVTYNSEEAAQLFDLYTHGHSRILVNYLRRFQPKYEQLRNEVFKLLNQGETIKHIRLNYKRGLINNASHLLDLVQFLTGIIISTENHRISKSECDVFPEDPTLSGILQQDTFAIELIGHPNADYPVFDCSIALSEYQVQITEAGDVWTISSKTNDSTPISSASEAITDYMIPVRERLKKMLEDQTINDNFTESLELNNRLLQLIMHQNHG